MMTHSKQSGVTLVIGMIFLLLLTLITLTAIQVTALEEKMAGNLYNQNIAFQAAESALREAEALIRTDAPPFNPLKLSGAPFGHSDQAACNHGMCSQSDSRIPESIPDMGGQTRVATTGIADIYAEPEYIIELARVEPSTDSSRVYATFRVTTIAWGRDANSVVRLQSAFRLHTNSFVH